MRLFFRTRPSIGAPEVERQVLDDNVAALQAVRTGAEGFVVNDGEWFWRNTKGGVSRSVVNSASFLSGRFQGELEARGWEQEATLDGQTIDAARSFAAKRKVYVLAETQMHDLLRELQRCTGESPWPDASELYRRFVLQGSATLDGIPAELGPMFEVVTRREQLRIGVEFETGNIASAFRAIKKLDNLFRSGHIVAGVFVTSIDKAGCSARIWPASNRNGSFEELDKRDFRRDLSVPLWEIGFCPDRFDRAAPFLADDGTTYEMEALGETETVAGARYSAHIDAKGQRKLRRTA